MSLRNVASQTHATETLRLDWFGWTTADWSVLSSIATIAGVIIALFGGYLALHTYRNASRMASHAHMHALFRDYLRTQFDFELGLMSLGERDEAEIRECLGREVAPLKLYVLEEMWNWLDAQTRKRDEWPMARRLSLRVRRRKEANDAWADTIFSHVVTDISAVIDNLKGATHCYSLGFLEFLADGLEEEDAEFRAIYDDQAGQIARGEDRTRYNLRHPTRPTSG
jgi:hypothetical protein